MRRVLAIALLLTGSVAAAQNKSQLPQELKGSDPAPDTKSAQDYLRRGRYEDALRQARLALTRDEKYVPAMLVMAKAYYYEKKYELASSILDLAKGIQPDNAEAYNLIGFIALVSHSEPDRISATAAFKKATELDEKYATAWNNLAAQYLFSKNYDGALTAAQRASELAPNSAKAFLNLGSAHRGKQEYAESEKAYKRALEIDPNYADAYFDLGILYLDAKEMPGTDTITKFNTAINYLNRYKQVAGYRLQKDDPADNYIAEARKGIDTETKRIERMKRNQQRNQAKPAPAAPTGKTGGDK